MDEFKVRPTELPAENDFNWPDQSLGYLSSTAYVYEETAETCSLVLPMWPASTWLCFSQAHWYNATGGATGEPCDLEQLPLSSCM